MSVLSHVQRWMALTLSASVVHAHAQSAATPEALGLTTNLVEVTLNLGLVLIAIFVLAWLFKRFQGIDQPSTGQLRVTAALPLGPKEKILVVEVGEEQILVGASQAGLTTLHVLAAPLNALSDSEDVDAVSFSAKLKRALQGVDAQPHSESRS
ncbi:MAG: flagellar biosynthetic protein FliO [Pseudomonadota bacterium]